MIKLFSRPWIRMEKRSRPTLYSGRRKGVIPLLCLFIILGLLISLERAVIDVLGQMWGIMLLNSIAVMFGITGLMGICAKDPTIIILYAVWSILSIALNILVILVYQNIGLLVQSEKYLGVLVGSSYWKTHGVRCSQEQQMNNSVQGEEGSAVLSNSSGMEIVDSDSDDCLVAYSTVETVHAAIYAFIAVISFILCTTFLLCPRRSNQIEDFDDDEEFSYVNMAQNLDYPGSSRSSSHRHTTSSLAK